MFDVVLNFWDWLVSGVCDPERRNDLVAQASTEESGVLIQSSPRAIDDAWKQQKVLSTRVFRLRRFQLEQANVDYLVEKTKKLPMHGRLIDLSLAWCTFDLHDGTADSVLELFLVNAPTLRSIRFWKTRQEDSVPNDILQQLLSHIIPQKMVQLFTLELSYFDLRQRRLNQALINMLSSKQPHPCILRHLDLSYCKTHLDFFQRFVSQGLQAHDRLETLSLSGTQMDDSTLNIFAQGLSKSPSRIIRLNLSHNNLTPASLPTLATLLYQQPKLEFLFLQYNEALLASGGFMQDNSNYVKSFATALSQQAPSLHTLSLAGCGLSNSSQLATVFFQELVDGSKKTIERKKRRRMMPKTNNNMVSGILCDLDLSQNTKLMAEPSWIRALGSVTTLQHISLPGHLRQDTKQYGRLCQLLIQSNCSLIELKFIYSNYHSSTQDGDIVHMKPSADIQAMLRRNQLLYLACQSAQSLPVSLWPQVITKLHDSGASGSSTSLYGFLQTLFVGE